MNSNQEISEAEKNFNQTLETLQDWRRQEINVGVIGQAKVGKSTLINTLLGYEYDEDGNLPSGAAAVNEAGVCTTEPRPFEHPENKRIKIWDLPGVDGSNFLLRNYWQKIRAKDSQLNPEGDIKYDFFIIALNNVIGTDASSLIEGAKTMKIKWYIVRTQIDVTIEFAKKRKRNEQKTIDETRGNLIIQLKEKCLEEGSDFNLYLVDGTERGKFEMPKLRDDLLTDCPEAKKLVLLRHAKENGKVVAMAKLTALQSRIPKVASACTKRDKIPLSSFFCKKKPEQLIVEEVLLYQQTFRLLKIDIEEFTRDHAKGKGNFEDIVRNHFEGEDPGLTFIRDQANKLRSTDSTEEVEKTAASIVALGVLGGVGVGVAAVSTGAVIAGAGGTATTGGAAAAAAAGTTAAGGTAVAAGGTAGVAGGTAAAAGGTAGMAGGAAGVAGGAAAAEGAAAGGLSVGGYALSAGAAVVGAVAAVAVVSVTSLIIGGVTIYKYSKTKDGYEEELRKRLNSTYKLAIKVEEEKAKLAGIY